jgi:ATP-binding cassette subfamily B multidrug efflux pump
MSSSVARLWPYVHRHLPDVLRGLGCALVATAISVLSPWILKYAIDDLQRGVTVEKLRFYAALMLGVAVVGVVFRFLMRRILLSAARFIEYDLRNDFFAHFERWALADFQRYRTGDLMSRTTNDLAAVRMMVAPAVMYAVFTALLFVVTLALMLSLSVWLTLLAIIPLPLIIVSITYFGAAIQRRFGRIQAQLAEISTIVQESLAGVRVIRAYRQEPHELWQFREANDEFIARNRRLVQLQGLFQPTLHLLLGLASLLVLWIGSREVIAGRLTIGEFVAFTAYLTMLSFPILAFGWITNLQQRGMASWQRMLELLETSPSITDQDAVPLPPRFALRGGVTFTGLTFTYDTTPVLTGRSPSDAAPRHALEDISFRVEPGQTVGIVGPTGSGKSTLVQLIARLHDPPPGTVFVDGVDVRQLPLSVLRSAIGFVPQEPFIFSTTLAANITFGTNHPLAADGRDLHWAAGVARLDKDIAQFPKAYDTLVGERGVTLSRGQKQRTALARALMVNPRILVLDDALSAVDTNTEAEILQRLRAVRSERTALIVSHRVSTVRDADLIIVLDRGRIVERGTHGHLVGLGGAYAALHRKQLLDEQRAASCQWPAL